MQQQRQRPDLLLPLTPVCKRVCILPLVASRPRKALAGELACTQKRHRLAGWLAGSSVYQSARAMPDAACRQPSCLPHRCRHICLAAGLCCAGSLTKPSCLQAAGLGMLG
jgi:hypothetical protein